MRPCHQRYCHCQGRQPAQELLAACASSRTDFAKDDHLHTVQVVLDDPGLSADGRRMKPVRYLERPIQKLILLLPSNDVPE